MNFVKENLEDRQSRDSHLQVRATPFSFAHSYRASHFALRHSQAISHSDKLRRLVKEDCSRCGVAGQLSRPLVVP
jgi:hypothetical protein